MFYLGSLLFRKYEDVPWVKEFFSNKVIGILFFALAACLLYFFGWLWWYGVQMRSWKLDYKSAVGRRERESLLAERRVMRMYAIPLMVLVPIKTMIDWERKHRNRKNATVSHEHHHRSSSGDGSHPDTQFYHGHRHHSEHHHHHHSSHHEHHHSEK